MRASFRLPEYQKSTPASPTFSILMPDHLEKLEKTNRETFRECLSLPIIQASAEKPGKGRRGRFSKRKAKRGRDNTSTTREEPTLFTPRNDAEELAEFIEVPKLTVTHPYAVGGT